MSNREDKYVDTLGSLHEWLGALLKSHPSLRTCSVFAFDGDCLSTSHFMWGVEDGSHAEIPDATEVTLYTRELPYEPTPDEQSLLNKKHDLEFLEQSLRGTLTRIADMVKCVEQDFDRRDKWLNRTKGELDDE